MNNIIMERLRVSFDTSLNRWAVSLDREIEPDVFYGKILGLFESEADARLFLEGFAATQVEPLAS